MRFPSVLLSVETHVAPSGLLYNWRFAHGFTPVTPFGVKVSAIGLSPIADTKIFIKIHDDAGLQCRWRQPQFLQVDNLWPV